MHITVTDPDPASFHLIGLVLILAASSFRRVIKAVQQTALEVHLGRRLAQRKGRVSASRLLFQLRVDIPGLAHPPDHKFQQRRGVIRKVLNREIDGLFLCQLKGLLRLISADKLGEIPEHKSSGTGLSKPETQLCFSFFHGDAGLNDQNFPFLLRGRLILLLDLADCPLQTGKKSGRRLVGSPKICLQVQKIQCDGQSRKRIFIKEAGGLLLHRAFFPPPVPENSASVFIGIDRKQPVCQKRTPGASGQILLLKTEIKGNRPHAISASVDLDVPVEHAGAFSAGRQHFPGPGHIVRSRKPAFQNF